jgi:hypothetical protein
MQMFSLQFCDHSGRVSRTVDVQVANLDAALAEANRQFCRIRDHGGAKLRATLRSIDVASSTGVLVAQVLCAETWGLMGGTPRPHGRAAHQD